MIMEKRACRILVVNGCLGQIISHPRRATVRDLRRGRLCQKHNYATYLHWSVRQLIREFNRPGRRHLTQLNLIDKVGERSSNDHMFLK
jgi:hypothetical protein